MLAIALLRRAPTSASASTSSPSFDVDDVEGAQWSSEVVGAQVHARLESGIASFHVEHTRPGQRFLLRMPDGEIEVHGTRFRVAVRRGATSRVDVSEGVVTLRLHGASERRLRAGDAWEAPARDGLSEDEAGVANGEIGAATAVESGARGNAPDAPSLAKTPDARQGAAQQDIFATAVAAFRSGSYRRAEQLFDRFLEGTPRDPRSEDAWFMKAVARSRLGDTEGAARLARDYLQRFPEGLRRPEAAQIEAAGQGSGSK
jgi:Tetratricopeptide repeat/FecR protein